MPKLMAEEWPRHSFEMPVALVSGNVQRLDEQVKSMMDLSENMLPMGNRRVRGKICKICGKEGLLANIKTSAGTLQSNNRRLIGCLISFIHWAGFNRSRFIGSAGDAQI